MANAITKVITWLSGEKVGSDSFGNTYYQHKKNEKQGMRRRRWVIYKEDDDASRVPSEYHAWLHYTINDFPDGPSAPLSWMKEHQPNRTGTPLAYRPPGHVLEGGKREKATGDYQAWVPE